MSKRARMEVPRNPRLGGVKEQVTRARLLLDEGHAVRDYDVAFRKLIAAVYPARAALEIMREAARLGELTVSLQEFDRRVEELVPRYRPIHTVRIRDFHRYGVQGGGRIMVEFQIRMPRLGHAELSTYPDPWTRGPKYGSLILQGPTSSC